MSRSLLVSVVTTAWLLAGGATRAADEAKPPANEDCLACHGDAGVTRSNGTSVAVKKAAFDSSVHGPMACVDCHADLAKTTEFPHPEKLAPVKCASCHDDVNAQYHDSIHARAREKAGLVVSPACADCHGTHDIAAPADPSSRVARANIPATCGTCHAGIRDRYNAGIHAVALRQGNPKAPVCSDCHTAHSIQRADTDGWRLSVARECGTCHARVVETFERTFHGKVTQLGFTRVATCADCHGAHDILPGSNPASTVSRARLVETCGGCHKGANARFVQYDPHPNPHDYSRGKVMWWANAFYWALIPACFGFFGLHSALWFTRSLKERRSAKER